MRIDKFKFYETLLSRGDRKKAKEALQQFLASFANLEEREEWTKIHLETLKDSQAVKIQKELYDEIILPVLFKGYQNHDLEAMLTLAHYEHNLFTSKMITSEGVYADLLEESASTLLGECVERHPENDELRKKYLAHQVQWFETSLEKWPVKLMNGTKAATIEGVLDIIMNIEEAKELDHEKEQEEYLKGYLEKVQSYLDYLIAYQPIEDAGTATKAHRFIKWIETKSFD